MSRRRESPSLCHDGRWHGRCRRRSILELRLAIAAMQFQNAQSAQHRLDAMVKGHKIALEIAGMVDEGTTYHQAIVENELPPLARWSRITGHSLP